MQEMTDFEEKLVLVTGGSRGIGRVIATRFAEANARVVVCSRNPMKDPPENVTSMTADLRVSAEVETVFEAIEIQFGSIDVLVNNAGGSPPAEASTASPRFSEKIIRLNLTSPLWCAQQANRRMQRQPDGGVIINVASVSGLRPSPGTAAYGAAKAGLINLTQSLAIEWAPKVRINAISPGLIETELSPLHYGDTQKMHQVAACVPLRRMGTPDDVAGACLFLASPAAAYMSGSNLVIHGGGEVPAFIAAAGDGIGLKETL